MLNSINCSRLHFGILLYITFLHHDKTNQNFILPHLYNINKEVRNLVKRNLIISKDYFTSSKIQELVEELKSPESYIYEAAVLLLLMYQENLPPLSSVEQNIHYPGYLFLCHEVCSKSSPVLESLPRDRILGFVNNFIEKTNLSDLSSSHQKILINFLFLQNKIKKLFQILLTSIEYGAILYIKSLLKINHVEVDIDYGLEMLVKKDSGVLRKSGGVPLYLSISSKYHEVILSLLEIFFSNPNNEHLREDVLNVFLAIWGGQNIQLMEKINLTEFIKYRV